MYYIIERSINFEIVYQICKFYIFQHGFRPILYSIKYSQQMNQYYALSKKSKIKKFLCGGSQEYLTPIVEVD